MSGSLAQIIIICKKIYKFAPALDGRRIMSYNLINKRSVG